MENNFFNFVRVTNFKSLKDVTLSDCKRINLLIGKPNVGKSNILEAIGLFSLPYLKYNKSKKITQFVRLENLAELFSDGDTEREISITTNDDSSCIVKYSKRSEIKAESSVHFEMKSKENVIIESMNGKNISCYKYENYFINLDNSFNLHFLLENLFKLKKNPTPKVKYYKFPNTFSSKKQTVSSSYLIPPIGVNLLEAIQESKIDKELAKIFSEYGLKLLFDKTNQTLRIDKPLKEGAASFPLSSIADTLQRVIFFKTAIVSNKNSIILFEEPEAHCFPPYIRHITQEIINSESNQFFIATHSPYVLNDFLEYQRDDVAIFMADFKDGQTVIKRLTDNEVNDVYGYGIDLFFNSELFTDEI